jgi:hypothetical protein
MAARWCRWCSTSPQAPAEGLGPTLALEWLNDPAPFQPAPEESLGNGRGGNDRHDINRSLMPESESNLG